MVRRGCPVRGRLRTVPGQKLQTKQKSRTETQKIRHASSLSQRRTRRITRTSTTLLLRGTRSERNRHTPDQSTSIVAVARRDNTARRRRDPPADAHRTRQENPGQAQRPRPCCPADGLRVGYDTNHPARLFDGQPNPRRLPGQKVPTPYGVLPPARPEGCASSTTG